jgi:RHS repeat-associated protein
MVNKYAYDEFGNVLNSQEAVTNPFKYVGQFGVMDEGNGLNFMRARYYDRDVGRFISKDPIGYGGGVNLFTYVADNPINKKDPLGLWWDAIDFGNQYYPGFPDAFCSLGAGGFGTFGPVGFGADSGIAVDTSGKICFYTTTCWYLGWNDIFGGTLGLVGQAGSGSLCSCDQETHGGYWYGGVGLGGQGSIQGSSNGPQFGRGILGPSYGGGTGYVGCKTTYYCLN